MSLNNISVILPIVFSVACAVDTTTTKAELAQHSVSVAPVYSEAGILQVDGVPSSGARPSDDDPAAGDTGSTDTTQGSTDGSTGGATDGGAADGGATDGGATDGGAADGGTGSDGTDGSADGGAAEAPVDSGDVFGAYSLYVSPTSNYATQADLWRSSDATSAALMDAMAAQPLSVWLGDWTSDPTATVDGLLDDAGSQLRSLVVYNIPNRDCGAWSAGGASDAASYADFVSKVAAGIEGRPVIVVLEPDALPLTHCLTDAQAEDRYAMMSSAVDVLTAAGASVYLDSGDSNWIDAETMAGKLEKAGVAKAAGISLNVSHTEYESNEMAFAEEIRAILGEDVHYVIDTSRSGLGPTADNEWCNPLGRAVGTLPTTATGVDGLDAYLWIKPPGESDGSCNGGPTAGKFWPEYALELADLASSI